MYFDHESQNEIVIYSDSTKNMQIGSFHSIPEYHDYWQFWFEWGSFDIAFRPMQVWSYNWFKRIYISNSLLRFDFSLPTLFICLRVHL